MELAFLDDFRTFFLTSEAYLNLSLVDLLKF